MTTQPSSPRSSIYTEFQQHLLISMINLHFSVILNFLECNIPNNFPKLTTTKGFDTGTCFYVQVNNKYNRLLRN